MPLTKLVVPPSDRLVAYVDEVGRGPLIHDVVVGCVIMPHEYDEDDEFVGKIKDSKKCSVKLLTELDEYIKDVAIAWGIGRASAQEIDDINILNATFMAMHRALDVVYEQVEFDEIYVDGNRFKPYITPCGADFVRHKCIVGGDAQYLGIAAASIIAKVCRDNLIDDLVVEHPEYEERYGLKSNKGYGTKEHLEGLTKYGPTTYHRRSFRPVAAAFSARD
jgi:ribonuclease HII